jgi:hypothetical protein
VVTILVLCHHDHSYMPSRLPRCCPDEEHERLAQAEYGRSYSDLDEHQRRHVGGKMAAETRAARCGGGQQQQQASEGQQREAGGADRQG